MQRFPLSGGMVSQCASFIGRRGIFIRASRTWDYDKLVSLIAFGRNIVEQLRKKVEYDQTGQPSQASGESDVSEDDEMFRVDV